MNPEYVLYVSPACSKSIALVNLLRSVPQDKILIQDVKLLNVLPPWLNGTPLLVQTKFGITYKGTDAINYVKMLLNSMQEEVVHHQVPTSPEKKDAHMSPPPSQHMSSPSMSTAGMIRNSSSNTDRMNDLFQIEDDIIDPKYQTKSRGISEQSLAVLQAERKVPEQGRKTILS